MKKWFISVFLLVSHQAFTQSVEFVTLTETPNDLDESSGLETSTLGCFWSHNDSGNTAELYCLDTTGIIVRQISVSGDENTDWEDLARDEEGSLYIGNFGNNSLNRTDLRIVKIPMIDTVSQVAHVSDTIRFTYPDQNGFPPDGSYGNFDMEAFFHFDGHLHLFSKDRSNPSTGFSKHYQLPDSGGTYVAELLDSVELGHTGFVMAVTAADISEDGSAMALLSADRIWYFSDFTGSDFFSGTMQSLQLGHFSQKEALCFQNGFMYLTDERSFGLGGGMYRVHPSVFVSVEESDSLPDLRPVYGSDRTFSHLDLPSGTEHMEWRLLDISGRLLDEGSADGRITRTMFRVSSAGMHVLQVADGRGNISAVLIEL